MSPDFDELIGDETRGRAREPPAGSSELLVSASPPPSLGPRPSRAGRVRALIPRSRALVAVGFAAAASLAVGLAAGFAIGNGSGFRNDFTRSMHGVGVAAAASASIRVGEEDASGNRPLEMAVRALPTLSNGRWYELYLTRKGKPVVPCGIFQTGSSGSARVRMNAPADLAEYDGWIVTALVPGHPRPDALRERPPHDVAPQRSCRRGVSAPATLAQAVEGELASMLLLDTSITMHIMRRHESRVAEGAP